MLPRRITRPLRKTLARSPAVLLLGPRQVGKTTLARSLGGAYFDLEQEPERLRLDLEWERLIARKRLLVLDEAQAYPPIFPRLRAAIDAARRRNGRFLLTGSVSPRLMRAVSEPLTGRLALLPLSPLLFSELETDAQRRRHWRVGGYPDGGILRPAQYPAWQRDYLSLLAQRDLPEWGLPAAPSTTQRLMRMLAISNGQVWNGAALGKSLGLDAKTVRRYVDFLEGAYLLRRLPPLHVNLKKRLVKAPKIYWRDSGLAHALLGLHAQDSLLDQPWVGASFEAYHVEQILSALQALGAQPVAHFFRTHDGREVDLVLDFGRTRWALEFKLSTQPTPQDFRHLAQLAEAIGAQLPILVSRAARSTQARGGIVCDLPWLLKKLPRLL